MAQFIQPFPIFWLDRHPVCVLWTFQIIPQPKRKIILASLNDPTVSSVWAGPGLVLCFLFIFTVIYMLTRYLYTQTDKCNSSST